MCFVKKLVKKTDTLSPFHTSVFASLHSLHQNKTKDISSSKYLCFNVSCTFSWGALGDSLPSSLTLSWKLQQQAALRYLVIMGASFGSWPVEAWVSWGPWWLGSDLLWSRMGTHWVLGDTCIFLKGFGFLLGLLSWYCSGESGAAFRTGTGWKCFKWWSENVWPYSVFINDNVLSIIVLMTVL